MAALTYQIGKGKIVLFFYGERSLPFLGVYYLTLSWREEAIRACWAAWSPLVPVSTRDVAAILAVAHDEALEQGLIPE